MLLCWLALLLIRVAERRTNLTWRRIELELSRPHAVTLTGSTRTVEPTTALTDAQAAVLRKEFQLLCIDLKRGTELRPRGRPGSTNPR